MRCTCALFPVLALVACGPAGDGNAGEFAPEPREVAADDRIACATGGAARFERVCTVEQSAGEGGTVLTVRAPNGGFRRLLVTGDGRGVVAADGAEAAVVTPRSDSEIEVAVGGDRYRLPATVREMTP